MKHALKGFAKCTCHYNHLSPIILKGCFVIMADIHCINVGGTFRVSYDLSAKKSSLQVCVELNLKCWQCFPREISRDENRKVLKRRVILFNVIQRHIHLLLCWSIAKEKKIMKISLIYFIQMTALKQVKLKILLEMC